MTGGQRTFGTDLRGSGHNSTGRLGAAGVVGLALLASLITSPAHAQYRKIGEMELRLSGLSATVENAEPVVPKHTPGGLSLIHI